MDWNRKGKRKRLVCFTIADIAKARGVETSAVHKAKQRGILDLDSIESIARYILHDKIEETKKSKRLGKGEVPSYVTVEKTNPKEIYQPKKKTERMYTLPGVEKPMNQQEYNEYLNSIE